MLDFRMIVTFEKTFTLIFLAINNSALSYRMAKKKTKQKKFVRVVASL